jgi:hypothetical protein
MSSGTVVVVLTVNGLAVFAPDDPNVVVHVLSGLGMVGTNPAQLAVSETPALTVTVSLLLPVVGPVQYIVKSHRPAATVCSGRLVNAQTVVTPPVADWMLQAFASGVLVPTFWSMVDAVQGLAPVPCR